MLERQLARLPREDVRLSTTAPVSVLSGVSTATAAATLFRCIPLNGSRAAQSRDRLCFLEPPSLLSVHLEDKTPRVLQGVKAGHGHDSIRTPLKVQHTEDKSSLTHRGLWQLSHTCFLQNPIRPQVASSRAGCLQTD